MRDAPSMTLAQLLEIRGVEVIGYDPLAKWDFPQAETVEAALEGADIAILVTEWDELVALKPKAFDGMRTKRLIDARNAWKYARDPGAVQYEGVGRMQNKENTPSSM